MKEQTLKQCRIWQLKRDVDVKKKFTGFERLVEEFGQPEASDYQIVYDGKADTDDLEGIYLKFNTAQPLGYSGHSLSVSDIVELYDDGDRTFYYIDTIGFQQIDISLPMCSKTLPLGRC